MIDRKFQHISLVFSQTFEASRGSRTFFRYFYRRLMRRSGVLQGCFVNRLRVVFAARLS